MKDFSNSKLSITLADQSFVSASNFLLGIILARFLGIEAFGIFTLLWMILLFVQSLQMAIIISPMMSIGPILDKADQKKYYQAVTTHQIIFSLVSSFCVYWFLILSNIFYPSWLLINYALPLSVTVFLSQNQDFIRRVFFIEERPLTALFCDLLAYGLRLIILVYLFKYNALEITNALWTISFALFISILLGLKIIYKPSINPRKIIDAHKRNWHTSRWLLASALLQWTSGNYFIITAGIILGPISVGILRAAGNVIGITNIIFLGLENIIPSTASKTFRESGISSLYVYLVKVLIYGGLFMIGVVSFLSIFSESLISILYGNEYSSSGYILIWYCLITLVQFINFPLVIGLRSLEHTKPMFFSYIVTTMFSVLCANIIVSELNLHGVMLGLLINNVIMVSISYHYFLKFYRLHNSNVKKMQ